MQVKAIRTEADYLEALRQVSTLIDLDPDPESPDGNRLEVVGTVVQAYEAEHHPIDPPDTIEAICFRTDKSSLALKDNNPKF